MIKMKKNEIKDPAIGVITIRGGADLIGKLNAIADQEGLSRGRLIRPILQDFIRKYEAAHGEVVVRKPKRVGVGLRVEDLTREQLSQAKGQMIVDSINRGEDRYSKADIMTPDDAVTDEEARKHYAKTMFVEEDFITSKDTTEPDQAAQH